MITPDNINPQRPAAYPDGTDNGVKHRHNVSAGKSATLDTRLTAHDHTPTNAQTRL